LIRHSTTRGELVDNARKNTRQLRNQLVLRQTGQARQVVDRLGAERSVQLIGRNRLVLPESDPRIDDVAVPTLLEALQQTAKAASRPPCG
jgi:hypothetical protein